MASKPTGTHGSLIIDDIGGRVYFRLSLSGSPSTFANGKSWSGTVNGVSVGGTFSISNGQTVNLGDWAVSSSQTVTLNMGATGTSGMGGPTSFSVAINRSLPVAPSGLTVTRVSDSTHTLNWSRQDTYTSVLVQRRVNGGAWSQVGAPTGNAYTFTDTTTQAGRKYEYRVAGRAASGTSAWAYSSAVYTTPAAPTGVQASRSGSNIVVSASSLPPYYTNFEVRDGATVVASGVSLPWTHVAPNAATPHTYTVRAHIALNDLYSVWSSPSNTVQLISPPNAPVSLSPNGGTVPSDEDVTLSWVHNPVDSSPQTVFEVRHRPTGGAWTTISGTTAGTVTVPLGAGDFEWEARTKGEHPDWSPWSATAVFEVIDRPGVAIIQPDATWDASILPVEWTFFQPQSHPQSGWELRLLDASLTVVESRSGSGPAGTVTVSERLSEGSWTVQVRAAAGDVWSDWAEVAFAVSFDPPARPLLSGVWDESVGGVLLQVGSGDPAGAITPVTNLFTNSSFEAGSGTVEVARQFCVNSRATVDTSSWTVVRGTLSRTTSVNPDASGPYRFGFSVTEVGGAPSVALFSKFVAAGSYEFHFKRDMGGASAIYAGAFGSTGTPLTATVLSTDSVVSILFDVPSDQIIQCRIGTPQGASIGTGIGFTDVALTRPGAPYFDGSFSPDPDRAPAWTGTPNASESVLTGVPVAGTSVGWQSSQWAASGEKSLRIPEGSVQEFTPAGQTFMVTPRDPGQTILIDDVPQTVGGPFRYYGTATIGLGAGWWDEVGIWDGDYDGPWYDGDTPSVTIDGQEVGTEWDGTPHESTTTTTQLPATVDVTVERDTGGGWEPIGVFAENATWVDWESLSYGDTLYRAVATTVEGATAVTQITVEARSHAFWLSGGPGFGVTCRLPYSPNVTDSGGRATAEKQWAGREEPVVIKGESVRRVLQVQGVVTDRYLYEPGASPSELRALINLPDVLHLLRTPDGERAYGGIPGVNIPRQGVTAHDDPLRPWNAFWGYQFELTEGTDA